MIRGDALGGALIEGWVGPVLAATSLGRAAAKGDRTLTAEIVRRLRASFDAASAPYTGTPPRYYQDGDEIGRPTGRLVGTNEVEP